MAEFHALVLAAGASRRFGGPKLLHPWGGGPLLHGALRAAFAAPVRRVVLVTGEDEAVARAGRAFAEGRPGPQLELAPSEDAAEGIAASIRAGVRALPPSADGALIFLADMPAVPESAGGLVIAALAGGALAAAPWRDGRPGHPVAVRRPLFPRLMQLTGDRGAGRLLQDLGDDFARVAIEDPGAFQDVDTPADLARLS